MIHLVCKYFIRLPIELDLKESPPSTPPSPLSVPWSWTLGGQRTRCLPHFGISSLFHVETSRKYRLYRHIKCRGLFSCIYLKCQFRTKAGKGKEFSVCSYPGRHPLPHHQVRHSRMYVKVYIEYKMQDVNLCML